MTLAVFHKLLAIFFTVVLGWLAGRQRWLGGRGGIGPAARALSDAAFYLFVPALLFRTHHCLVAVRHDDAAGPGGSDGGLQARPVGVVAERGAAVQLLAPASTVHLH